MQHAQMKQRRTCSGVGWLQAVVRHGSGVGVLVVLLLLPLLAAWQDTLEALTAPDEDEAVETLAVTAPREGDLDTSFSSTDMVLTNFGSNRFDRAESLAIQSDGKIVVAGLSFISGNGDFALARYLTNGALDTTFSGDGKVLTNFADDKAEAVALQPDGKIVVAGFSTASGTADFALARYLTNGALDTTFGSVGKVTTDIGSLFDRAEAVVLQPDGKIVVAGTSFDANGTADFALARYLTNGALDTTFSSDGKVTTDFGDSDEAYAVALQPDGKIVVAGFSGAFGNFHIALARYLTNGALDTTFSTGGKVLTNFNGFSPRAFALAIQPRDGRLVVAGESIGEFVLARYHAITCGGVVVTRIGTNRSETIMGTSGNDVIYGFGGNDIILGLGGNDILCGGTGNDTLYGGSGDDILRGGAGTDTCDGGAHVSGDRAFECESVPGVP